MIARDCAVMSKFAVTKLTYSAGIENKCVPKVVRLANRMIHGRLRYGLVWLKIIKISLRESSGMV